MSTTKPSVLISATDFSPGYLDTPEQDSLPSGATPDALNCLFVSTETQDETRSVIRRRLGCLLINPTAIASQQPVDVWQFDREDAASELVALCDGALYVWDGASTFNAITNGGGFTPGTPATAFQFKNNLIVSDGTQQLRYDGTAAFPVGFAAPTGAPGLAPAAGPGVTGTYEGFAVWLDQTTGHLSSPSAFTGQVVFANQQRQWTKPAGAPPANVTHWRIYCRRADTNEVNYFRTGLDQPVGTAAYTEAFADDTRTVIGPLDESNDVPPVFAIGCEWKQYRLAVKPNSSDLYVSAVGDAESQSPNDIFLVGGRGDAKEVRSVRTFGENVYLRKPYKAYTLVGDAVPFQIVPAGMYGSVSQDAGIEIDGLWFDWDERRGPYATDMTSTWTPLADNRIKNVVNTVNKLFLDRIRVAHAQFYNLILWAVPTTSSRKRTILAYNYRLQRWLPPITGFEFNAMTAFITTTGSEGVYFGDEWGRVYELFSGDLDGPPSGTLIAPITGAGAGSITAGTAAFFTTGAGLAGMPVAVVSPTGSWQWVRARSNTGTVITLDTVNGPALNPIPATDGTWSVVLGAIQGYWTTPRLTGGNRMTEKRGRYFWIGGATPSANSPIIVQLRYNRSNGYADVFSVGFPSQGLVWGEGEWGVDSWGIGGSRSFRQHRLNRSFFDVQAQWSNFFPNQWFLVAEYGVAADLLPRRKQLSA